MQHQTEIYGLVWSLTSSCVLTSLIGMLVVRPLTRITRIPGRVLVPFVLCVALVGSWAVDQAVENMLVTAFFGALGYLLIRLEYPRLPIVIAVVLGGAMERNFHQSMAMSDGAASIFVTRPIALTLVLMTLGVLALPPLRLLRQSARLRRNAASAGRACWRAGHRFCRIW